MRISDWSSDVCSSDLLDLAVDGRCQRDRRHRVGNIFGRDGLDESMGKTNFVAHGRTERNRPQEFHKLGRPHDGKGGRTGLDELFLRKLCAKISAVLEPVRSHDRERDMMADAGFRSEEHTSELKSLMRISYAVFCLKKNKK